MKLQHSNTRKLALLSVLAALCLAIQLTPRPPNVEFTSFFTFIVGLIYGALNGAFFGCFVMFVNGFLSPYGFSGLNMPFQMVGMAITGILGGVYKSHISERDNSARFCIEAAILGAFSALIFDLITNAGVSFSYILAGMDPILALLTAVAYGTFFSIIHISSNTTVFGVLTLPSIKALDNLIGGGELWLRKDHSYLQH
ncbi:MAG: ECF transporter S component [Candidatus Bathyarchaeia archaeon]|nr:ECF transporter S component [Candidatus Bathyarchaeia archaeon]